MGAVVISMGLFFVFPENTNASVLSFIADLLSGTTVSANTTISSSPSTTNSQSMTLLEAAVNTNPNPTQITDLNIVDDSVLETSSGPNGTTQEVEAKMANGDKVSIYVVRSGDTLSGIAQMFNVTANTVMWANDIKSSKDLKVGQELIILPISGVQYTVKKGDTLQSIAKKFGGSVDEIVDFNNLTSSASIYVGQEITIPDGEESDSVGSKPSTSSAKTTVSKSLSGYFIRPTTGVRTQGLHGKYNTAVDFGTPVGTPVKAAASGRVIVAKSYGYNGGYGNYIVVQHSNGMQTIYAHLSFVGVSTGTTVGQGQVIGKTGNSGNSTGPHLHFEILGTRNWNPF